MKSYSARSLEDIANHFDTMSERAAANASHASTKVQARVLNSESRTWSIAAEMLRDTTLRDDA